MLFGFGYFLQDDISHQTRKKMKSTISRMMKRGYSEVKIVKHIARTYNLSSDDAKKKLKLYRADKLG